MKTLFITSFHPHISRNILSTAVLEQLKAQQDLRLVVIVPDYKADYFRERFDDSRIIIEGIVPNQSSLFKRVVLFKRIAAFLPDNATTRLRKRFTYHVDGRFFYFISSMAIGYVLNPFFMRRVWRWLDRMCSPSCFFDDLFSRYKPDALFSTDPQNENDVSMIYAARVRGVPVIAMVRSWDNPTMRNFRVFPDLFLAGSKAIGDEMGYFHGYPEERIIVTGQPHYDRYIGAPPHSREEFCAQFGLDPKRRLIMYAPLGDLTINNHNDVDQYVMEILGDLDAQIMVRFPPDEKVSLIDFVQPANMIIHRPGHVFGGARFTDREIRKEDDDSLIDQIFYSDLVITGPTSISLDASLRDKPVIVVDFYPTERNFFDTAYQYNANHIRKLLGTGGVYHATSKEGFLSAVHDYMNDSHRDALGRATIRSLWFSHADGHAGERVAREIIEFVHAAR